MSWKTSLWDWFLHNANLITILGVYRLWSRHEHKKTEKHLENISKTLGNGRDHGI